MIYLKGTRRQFLSAAAWTGGSLSVFSRSPYPGEEGEEISPAEDLTPIPKLRCKNHM
jgi:hypothetical protein